MLTKEHTGPRVVATPGALPPFWPDRNVIFFANLLALFFGNEAQVQALRDEVGEIDSYGSRLIPIIDLLFRREGRSNLLVLEREPDYSLCGYFERELGLSLPQLQVLSHEDYLAVGRGLAAGGRDVDRLLRHTANHTAEWIDGFVTDATLAAIAEHLQRKTIATHAGSHRGNNKLLLHEFILESGLPAVEYRRAESPADVRRCTRELAAEGFRRAVVKAQIGATGIGMVKIPDIQQEDAWPVIDETLFYDGPAVVEGWLEPGFDKITRMRSPSVQMFLNNDAVHIYDMTEQFLSRESVHEGNTSPPPYLRDWEGLEGELIAQAGVVGTWLHAQGYRGTASTDFLLADREGQSHPTAYVCEINARVTGATYPSVLARHHLPQGAWLLRNLRLRVALTGDQVLDMFRKPGHLFQPAASAGILPINFNFGDDNLVHKGQFLFLAATVDECLKLVNAAEHDLPVQWDYDRD